MYFVSNNSSKSRAEYLQKFDKLDFEAYEVRILQYIVIVLVSCLHFSGGDLLHQLRDCILPEAHSAVPGEGVPGGDGGLWLRAGTHGHDLCGPWTRPHSRGVARLGQNIARSRGTFVFGGNSVNLFLFSRIAFCTSNRSILGKEDVHV